MNRTLRVLLGVSGGIAAYKAAELVRRLRSRGHEVRCALTRSAASFVTPLTLEVLTGHPVYQEEYLTATGTGEEAHITAAAWADVLCVAPATTNVIAKLALGLGDDFLTTTALAFTGPAVVAPAMHSAMWERETTRQHVEALRRRGVWIAGPVEGPLASGEVGMGRMTEPEAIAEAVEAAAGGGPLAGHTVLVTAGPTHEPLDPVRFLGNRSSGKMGFALAAEAARRGARVVLVAGPVSLPTPPGVSRLNVVTARDMERAVREHAPAADLIVMAAAVADFRPSRPADAKIKKERGLPVIELEENPDILAGLRAVAPRAVLAGFAAETGDLEKNARAKLERKRADFLVANDVSRTDIAFESGDNEVTVFRKEGPPVFFPRRPKPELAASLFDLFTATLLDREREPAASPR
ncbi:MAG TPA: bifunctional phosphopantothenoylcysteine decarboxylase/phosphopantothenate--cysteine ligase CoaBC [Thermoanaerobaculia bacterium]|jgi:phosphopantothenoylcysteine decarboxylase/phosphopantothenate--cysteine ligase|nr:bifunctional phosphopantothenoylcysteine decarboxylase/phosphopantothenate--cysteine ligase CoaBC [Thermoanaerobaculia bacterium]